MQSSEKWHFLPRLLIVATLGEGGGREKNCKKKKKWIDPLVLYIFFIQPFATKKGRKQTCQHYKQQSVKNGRKKKKNATFLTPRKKEKIDCNGVWTVFRSNVNTRGILNNQRIQHRRRYTSPDNVIKLVCEQEKWTRLRVNHALELSRGEHCGLCCLQVKTTTTPQQTTTAKSDVNILRRSLEDSFWSMCLCVTSFNTPPPLSPLAFNTRTIWTLSCSFVHVLVWTHSRSLGAACQAPSGNPGLSFPGVIPVSYFSSFCYQRVFPL